MEIHSRMLIITGTYPPQRCGVGDYTQRILSTSIASGWSLFYQKDWQLGNLSQLCRKLKSTTDRVVCLQYPTMGYGTQITPHLLAIYAVVFERRKLILTIHEYSQLGWKGKLALKLLFFFASMVVFTTEFERDAAKKRNPLLRHTSIIKINSNIPASACPATAAERGWDICYFGYIRPLKGLEVFVDVVSRLRKEHPSLRIYVMGQTQPEYASFYEPMLERLRAEGIEYFGDKSSDEVSDMLNHTKIAYLPYPDGLSERRGSFLAAAVNGCVVVSEEGQFTTASQRENIVLSTKQSAGRVILDLLSDEQKLNNVQKRLLEYVSRNVPCSWDEISSAYKAIEDAL